MPSHEMKHCLIRTDASLKIGTGHIYRNLNLAIFLSKNGYKVSFVSRGLPDNLYNLLKDNGFDVLALNVQSVSFKIPTYHCPYGEWLGVSYQQEIEDSLSLFQGYCEINKVKYIDWLIVDHYGIDFQWHNRMRKKTKYILQIDDLADRVHDCDILVDQNYHMNMDTRYTNLLSSNTKSLLGPKYAILNKDFEKYRYSLPEYSERLKKNKIVLFFGGIDQCNETEKAIKGLISVVDENTKLDVIIGLNNPHKDKLIFLYSNIKNILISVQVTDMAKRLSEAFLFIGAVGTVTWERCSLALPAIVVSVAKNQVELAKSLDGIGSHLYLGDSDFTQCTDYTNAYSELFNDKSRLLEQSMISEKLSDGMGVNRILIEMLDNYVD